MSSGGATKKAKKPTSTDTKSTQVEGVVYKVSDTRIVIAVEPSDSASEDLDLPECCRVVKLANGVTYDRHISFAFSEARNSDQLRAAWTRQLITLRRLLYLLSVVSAWIFQSITKLLQGDASKAAVNPLIQVLLGTTPPSRRVPLDNIVFFDEHLNESQKEAVTFCLESPEVACIHGPPGTGKTHTLIEIIHQLTAESPRIPRPSHFSSVAPPTCQ